MVIMPLTRSSANSGKCIARVFSDDTEVFVLLVRWMYREEMVQCLQTPLLALPQQLRHDIIAIRQSQYQCAKDLAH